MTIRTDVVRVTLELQVDPDDGMFMLLHQNAPAEYSSRYGQNFQDILNKAASTAKVLSIDPVER